MAFVNFDENILKDFKKPQLIELIKSLKAENDNLKVNQVSVDDRITELERSHYLYLQYGRRNSVEISGIPSTIETENLEDEVIKIYNTAGVKVHDRALTKFDIEAAHRIGRKGVTIVRFTNRKFAYQGLRCGRNLKGKNLCLLTTVSVKNFSILVL